ncbi:hypothetical protein D477_002933 [Arthrobacter crystallopoietes BAB-32]|uniref:Uncharacterized protein n=1 Tax=Arthrobacter crystallopoietes BAB-32 TaxID=1246476 RepID=N1V2Z3_9MICC|nr:hypothetical protein [Arthrobacter crystallopoietes]EMY35705.1 hypothetical protein D477_002933 [Arthrobacter crystallopoietes BAB-32]
MADKPKSVLLPIMAAAVFGGLARLVLRKFRTDRQAQRAAQEDLARRVSEAVRRPRP